MRFKKILFLIPLIFFTSCHQPQMPEVNYVAVYSVEPYYHVEFVKLINSDQALVYDFYFRYFLEIRGRGSFELTSGETGPVWDVARLGNSMGNYEAFIQFSDTAALAYYDVANDAFYMVYLQRNPGFTGLYPRDSISVYGVRNDSVFIFYPDSLQEELFAVLPFSTRHIIVSPDGRYVGTPEGKIYDIQQGRIVGDFGNLGWDFSFYDDTTVIFGDSCGGFAVKWLRVTDGRVVKAVPVTDEYVFKPVRFGDRIFFVSGHPYLRRLRNYQYHVLGTLYEFFE